MGLFGIKKNSVVIKAPVAAELIPPEKGTGDPYAQEKFLDALSEHPNVAMAARASGYHVNTWRALRKRDVAFAKRWDVALTCGADALDEAARKRAVDGVEEPVYYQGEVVGSVTKYSDALLSQMLRAHHPAYRDRREIDLVAKVEVNWSDFVESMRKEAEEDEVIDVTPRK